MQTTEVAAGRELDTLIAERVFALTVVEDPVNYRGVQIARAGREGSDLPHYSTDHAAAWQVVEQMQAQGWNFACDDMGGLPWWVEFSQAGYRRGGQNTASTLPLAVCRAALAALG